MTPDELLGPPHPADPPGYVNRRVAVIALNAAVQAEREELDRFAEHVQMIAKIASLGSQSTLPNISRQLLALSEDAQAIRARTAQEEGK